MTGHGRLLGLVAVIEAATGFALLAQPSVVVDLLFGAEPAGAGVVASRVAGASLVALGVACWPATTVKQGLRGMLVYSLLVTIYFALLGIEGTWVGTLLWPAVAAHAVLTVFLARAWFSTGFTAERHP